ncbi:unnamed protein product [Heterobilharzia americana]|nr:unnamed protein product [Heterobilharzia americana]CAH8458400.1 unnamed protein product [Heterobilharzia americana]
MIMSTTHFKHENPSPEHCNQSIHFSFRNEQINGFTIDAILGNHNTEQNKISLNGAKLNGNTDSCFKRVDTCYNNISVSTDMKMDSISSK